MIITTECVIMQDICRDGIREIVQFLTQLQRLASSLQESIIFSVKSQCTIVPTLQFSNEDISREPLETGTLASHFLAGLFKYEEVLEGVGGGCFFPLTPVHPPPAHQPANQPPACYDHLLEKEVFVVMIITVVYIYLYHFFSTPFLLILGMRKYTTKEV